MNLRPGAAYLPVLTKPASLASFASYADPNPVISTKASQTFTHTQKYILYMCDMELI